jgi:hypothetical protein
MAYGSMRRLPRTSPDVALQFKDWVIPPGVSQARDSQSYFCQVHTLIFVYHRLLLA